MSGVRLLEKYQSCDRKSCILADKCLRLASNFNYDWCFHSSKYKKLMRAAAEPRTLKYGKFLFYVALYNLKLCLIAQNTVLGCSVHHLYMYAAFPCVCVYAHVCIFVLLGDTLFLASPRSSAAAPPPTISGAPLSLAYPVVPVPLIRGLALQRTTRHTVHRPGSRSPPNIRQVRQNVHAHHRC